MAGAGDRKLMVAGTPLGAVDRGWAGDLAPQHQISASHIVRGALNASQDAKSFPPSGQPPSIWTRSGTFPTCWSLGRNDGPPIHLTWITARSLNKNLQNLRFTPRPIR